MSQVPTRSFVQRLSAAATARADAQWAWNWAAQGRFANQDPDALFGEGSQQRLAKVVCERCPVIAECLADALDNRTPFGVWGGMTERERRALLRTCPDVPSWSAVLQGMRAGDAGPVRVTQGAGTAGTS